MVVGIGMLAGTMGTWAAEEGDVTTNADIDFSNPITDNVVKGTFGEMVIGQNEKTPTEINDDGRLVLGNGTHTVTIQDVAGEKDKVTVSFDLAFGQLSKRNVAFSILDTEGATVASFSYYGITPDVTGTLGIEKDDLAWAKGSGADWNKKVSFTIVFDYFAKKITTTTSCEQAKNTSATHTVELTTDKPIKVFKLLSDYTIKGRRGEFDNLKITTTKGDYNASTYPYSINAVSGETVLKTIEEGQAAIGEGFGISNLSEVIAVDKVYYQLNDGNVTDYTATFTMDKENDVKTVNYRRADDIVFFQEFENMEDNNSYGIENIDGFSAGRGGVVKKTDVSITTTFNVSETGTYRLVIPYYNSDSKDRSYSVLVDGVERDALKVGKKTSGLFTLDVEWEAGEHKVAIKCVYNRTPVFDYLLVERLPESLSVSVSESGYATLTSKYTLDFSNSSIKAYTATMADGVVNLTRTDLVPAGEGVLLYSKDAKTDEVAVVVSAPALTDNAFIGTLTDLTLTEGYVLNEVNGVVGFYKAAGEGTLVAAGKAYLPASVSEAKTLKVVFDGTNGISDVMSKVGPQADNVYYNLNGQRVAHPTKGLYILNGKKVIRNK